MTLRSNSGLLRLWTSVAILPLEKNPAHLRRLWKKRARLSGTLRFQLRAQVALWQLLSSRPLQVCRSMRRRRACTGHLWRTALGLPLSHSLPLPGMLPSPVHRLVMSHSLCRKYAPNLALRWPLSFSAFPHLWRSRPTSSVHRRRRRCPRRRTVSVAGSAAPGQGLDICLLLSVTPQRPAWRRLPLAMRTWRWTWKTGSTRIDRVRGSDAAVQDRQVLALILLVRATILRIPTRCRRRPPKHVREVHATDVPSVQRHCRRRATSARGASTHAEYNPSSIVKHASRLRPVKSTETVSICVAVGTVSKEKLLSRVWAPEHSVREQRRQVCRRFGAG
mmetsp:Transcript_176146/g.559714  ORF Transcript_176146/g.559714 Transcript_176146/m.559714 type:complete len:334 (+) Transcript_176146:1-1002(+)